MLFFPAAALILQRPHPSAAACCALLCLAACAIGNLPWREEDTLQEDPRAIRHPLQPNGALSSHMRRPASVLQELPKVHFYCRQLPVALCRPARVRTRLRTTALPTLHAGCWQIVRNGTVGVAPVEGHWQLRLFHPCTRYRTLNMRHLACWCRGHCPPYGAGVDIL